MNDNKNQIGFTLPLVGTPGSATKRQLEFLEDFGLDGCENFSKDQASMMISAMEYGRVVFHTVNPEADGLPIWKHHRIMQFIINNPEIRNYVIERNKELFSQRISEDDVEPEQNEHFRRIQFFIDVELPKMKPNKIGFLKWLFIIALAIAAFYFLSGCATPPGQLKESDLVWQERTIAANYQEVYRNVKDGFKTCGPNSIDSELYTDIRKGHFDIYHSTLAVPKSMSRTVGLIDITPKGDSNSLIKVGVNTYDENFPFVTKGVLHKRWLRWAEGDLVCG